MNGLTTDFMNEIRFADTFLILLLESQPFSPLKRLMWVFSWNTLELTWGAWTSNSPYGLQCGILWALQWRCYWARRGARRRNPPLRGWECKSRPNLQTELPATKLYSLHFRLVILLLHVLEPFRCLSAVSTVLLT